MGFRKTFRRRDTPHVKTRRGVRKQQGGAVSKLPPLPSGFSWDLKFLGGHGGLTGDVFVVPPNTYIMNVATAGRPCKKEGFHIENTLFEIVSGKYDEAKRKLTHMLTTNAFLKSSSSDEYIFNEKNTSGNVEELYGSSSIKKQKTIAFYEPGDLMPDNLISVFNDNLPFFVMGLYNVPVKHSIWSSFQDDDEARSSEYNEYFKTKVSKTNISGKSAKELRTLFYEKTKDKFTEDHKKLLNKPSNLLKDKMFDATGEPIRHEFRISEIVGPTILGPVPSNTIRVLFVKACRGVLPLPGDTNASLKTRTNRVRRWSISSRQRFLPEPAATGVGTARAEPAATGVGTARAEPVATGVGTAAATGGGTARAEPAATGGGTARAEPVATGYQLRKQRLRLDLLLQLQKQFRKMGVKNKSSQTIDNAIVKLQAGETFNLETLYEALLQIQEDYKALDSLTKILT